MSFTATSSPSSDELRAEWRPLLWSAALFFCLLFAYYLLRPVREVFGIRAGEVYQWLWTGTAGLSLVVTPIFGWLVSRFPRRVFVPVVYGGAAVSLVVFHQAHAMAPEGAVRLWIGYGFYMYVSTLAVFSTAVFWGLMADGWGDSAARRRFGQIAVGGTLGALVGSRAAKLLAEWFESPADPDLMLVSAGAFVVAAVLARACMGSLGEQAAAGSDQRMGAGFGAAVAGVRLFSSSPYLLAIGLFLAGQTFAGTFLYIERGAFLAELLPTRGVEAAVAKANAAAQGSFFSNVDFYTNVLVLGVQLFLVGRLVRWVGVGLMLATLPLVNLAGFSLLLLGPSLLAYGVFEVLQRASRFAVMKPAREMLFTVLSREEKYKAKQFLDTAVYRGTDAGWGWIDEWLRGLLGPAALKLGVVVPVCGLWGLLGVRLGRMNARRRAESRPTPSAADAVSG